MSRDDDLTTPRDQAIAERDRGATGRPADDDDAAWDRLAKEAQRDAVTNIRASAEKWSATISTLTGIFSVIVLIEGPKDVSKLTQSNQDRVQWALIIGVAAAAVSILLAGLAAQGWSADIWDTGSEYRRQSKERANTASKLLMASRILVPVAVVALGVAIFTTWFGDRTEASTNAGGSAIVIGDNGQVACGKVSTVDEVITVAAENGTAINVGTIRTLTLVDACPKP